MPSLLGQLMLPQRSSTRSLRLPPDAKREARGTASYPDVSLSLDENVREKEDRKEITGVPFPWSLAVHRGRDWSPVKSTSAWVGSLARLHVLGQQFLKFLLCLLQPAIHSRHHSKVSPTPSKSWLRYKVSGNMKPCYRYKAGPGCSKGR